MLRDLLSFECEVCAEHLNFDCVLRGQQGYEIHRKMRPRLEDIAVNPISCDLVKLLDDACTFIEINIFYIPI